MTWGGLETHRLNPGIMSLTCKKCGKRDIDDEAFNTRQGGFLCKSCYRSSRLQFAGCAIAIAVVGFVLIVLLLGMILYWTNGD